MSPMKKPKFSVAASTTKKPKTTFSRFTRSSCSRRLPSPDLVDPKPGPAGQGAVRVLVTGAPGLHEATGPGMRRSVGSARDLEAGSVRVVRRRGRNQRPDTAAARLPGAAGPVAGGADGAVRLLRGRTRPCPAAGRPAVGPARPPTGRDPR